MNSQRESLRRHSVIVADTSDLSTIARHAPATAVELLADGMRRSAADTRRLEALIETRRAR